MCMFFLDEKGGDPLLTYMGLIGCSHTGWPVSLDQVYLVWLPAWASEPGSPHAKSRLEPGSPGTQRAAISGGPGSHHASLCTVNNIINILFVYINWY